MISTIRRVSFSVPTLFGRIGVRMSSSLVDGSAEGDKKLVIFDKDGTLMCMNAMLAPWMVQVAEKMEAVTGLPLKTEVYKEMGFNPESRKFESGHVLESTNQVCVQALVDLLESKGLGAEKAQSVAVDCYGKDGRAAHSGELLPFGDVQSIFSRLKDRGYLVAVNTSDTRTMTEHVMDRLGVTDLLDMVICGSDAGVIPKPDPYTALKICSTLGVEPKNSVFIGDTLTDALCGKNAECGLVISVLSGGIDKSILEDKADIVVDTIEEAAQHILNQT